MLSAADCGMCCFIGRDASVGEEALRWFDECFDEGSVGVLLGNVCGHGCKCSSKAEVLRISGASPVPCHAWVRSWELGGACSSSRRPSLGKV